MKNVIEILAQVETMVESELVTINQWKLLEMDLQEVEDVIGERDEKIENLEEEIEDQKVLFIKRAEKVAMDFYLEERVPFGRVTPFHNELQLKGAYYHLSTQEVAEAIEDLYADIVGGIE